MTADRVFARVYEQVGVQQAVTLPAAGTQVEFTVYVLDRRLNRSNELMGTFVAC